ncbi:MAG TPA: Calx-beta domain-containing protein [Pyrinomonadaceae bacterium]|jgi:hypothetical protein
MNFVTRAARKSPRFIAVGLLITLVSSIVLASHWDSLSAFAFSFGANAQAEQKTPLASASKNTPNLESLLKPGETTINNFVSPATTTLIDPTGAGGFENGATLPLNGWSVVNGASNIWLVGSATTNGGTQAAYISNNGGAANQYTISPTAYTGHFWRDITFPAGETIIQLSFNWRNTGENGFDRLLVYTAPTSVTPVANSPVSSSTTLTGATLISGTTLHSQATYTTFNATLPASFAGTTQRLIFTWQNDTSGGVDPPAAVDNISLTSTAPVPVCGTRTVGPTGNYASLTAAFADLNINGVCGSLLLELQAAYASGVETFPIVAGNIPNNSPTNTITVRPETGATALSITSANTTATVDLNGAANVILDGRPGGLGTTKQLTIANTSTAGTAVRFINDANLNRIQYATLAGVNTSTTNGVVLFSTTTGANGNDNNTIDNCDIRDGATTPTNGIFSSGSTTTTATNNSGNTISNNNIFNYFISSSTSAGVLISSGTTDWTISGNSFYQTATRTATAAATVYGISIANTSGTNFVVTNNFVGGTAASAGGTPWTIAGTFANRFNGIGLSVSTAAPVSSVQGNTIANFTFTSTSSATANSTSSPLGTGVWGGIFVGAGSANVGTITGNTIGSGTGTGSINVTVSSNAGATANGMGVSGSGTVNFSNNTIGSITTNGATAAISTGIIGIQSASTGTVTINNNTIGSTTTANSLNASLASTGTTAQVVTGINNSGAATLLSITNNTIANLNSAYLPAAANANRIMGGIISSNGTNTITGNTVRNLTTAANATGTTTAAVVQGITYSGSTSPLTISNNTIFALVSNHATAATSVTGIHNFGSGTGNIIARNFVYNLTNASTAGIINGIFATSATNVYQNNIIDLGNSLTTSAQINGINETGGTNNFYHNSVYIGGANVVSGTVNTFAFNSTVTASTRNYRNNIFFNARSNTSGTGAHYGIQVGGTAANPAGLTSNNNIILANGSGGVFGRFNAINRADIAAWRTATGQDASSFEANPQYIDPTNATPNLHLQPATATIAEGNGADVGVTDDFDGQTRSTLTPVDIGADAGNFISAGDFGAPAVSYTPLANTASTADRTLSGVTASDSVGVTAVRVYFKKSTDGTYTLSNACTLTGGNANSGTYDCLISTSALSPIAGDIIQYFVAAQDAAGNIGSFPAGAAGTSVTTLTTFPTTPSSYTILQGFGGAGNPSKTVCPAASPNAPCDYTSLTNAGGIFAAMNAGVLNGNFTILISDDLTGELGTNSLNQQIEDGGSGFTVTISPTGGAARLIRSDTTTPPSAALINLNGADRVTIDGLNTGGNALTIRNTSATGAAIRFIADASNNAVQNATVEGATTSTTSGVIFFSTGTTTGNDSNTITSNTIRDRSDAAGVPANLIFSSGSSSAITNTGNTISNNQLFNFTAMGIQMSGTGSSNGNENWTIGGNTIYEATARTTALTGINFNAIGTNTITQNIIRDLNTTSTSTHRGIHLLDARNTTVSRNLIYNFSSTGTLEGIEFSGSSGNPALATIVNNMISVVPGASGSQVIHGLFDNGFSGNTVNMYFNTVLVSGTGTSTANTYACRRGSAAPTVSTWRDNLCFNNRTGGTGNHFAMGDSSDTTGTLTLNYNIYVGTGATAANFFDRSASSTVVPVNFAAWQVGGRDANSQASNPGVGNYTLANMFVSDSDLHLANEGMNPASNVGTPVTGITTDFDNDTRSATTPEIGADEFNVAATPGTFQFSSATYSVGEGGGSIAAVVTRTGGASGVVSIAYTISDNTATGGSPCGTAGVDFDNTFVPLVFANGETSKNITIPICDDALFESNELFSLTLNSASGGATIGTPFQTVVTINDNDAAPAPSINVSPTSIPFGNQIVSTTSSQVNVTVTNNGTGNLTLGTLTLTGTNPGEFSILNNPSGATVTPGNNVQFQVTFTPTTTGAKTATITIPNNDTGNPNPTVSLSGTGIQPGALQFSAPTYAVGESGGTATISVTRTGGTDGAVGIGFASVAGGTATGGASCAAGVDYMNTSGTLSWTNGDSASKTFSVTVCSDNLFETPNETVNLAVTTPTGGATLGTPNTAVLTINEDDAQPSLQYSAAAVSVGEGVGTVTLTVTRTGAPDNVVSAAYSTPSNTASGGGSCAAPGVDFINTAGTVSFGAGVTSQTFNVTICNDNLFESSENFVASLSTPTGGAGIGSPGSETVTITENDTAPTFQFSSATYTNNDDIAANIGKADELAPQTATITVTRSGATENAVAVNFATVAGGTATAGASCTTGVDYISTNGTLNFASGVTSQTFNVTVCSDNLFEGNESVNLALSGQTAPAVLGTPSTAVLTIVDNETVPSLQFSSPTYSNSDDITKFGVTTDEFAPSAATITVTRTGATDNAVSVNYATSNGTATGGASCTAGIDYISTSGTLNFAAGVTSQTFNVTVCTDALFEGSETVNLTLSNPSAPAALGTPNSAVLTILDNDAQPSLQFSSPTYSVGEGGGGATITVTRTGATDNAVSVDYASSNGTATGGASCGAGVDYQNASGTLNFGSGITSQTFSVPICEDALSEGNETVNLALSTPGGAILGTPNTAVLTITDNDGAPSLQFSTATDTIGEAGGSITFTVTRTGATGNAVSVDYQNNDGTATGGGCGLGIDFGNVFGTLNFASGETSKTFNVTICDDSLLESSETFTASLSNPTGGATLGTPAIETVTITDNDTAPTVQFSAATYSTVETLGDSGAVPGATITVTRTGATENPFTVNYATSNGTASGGASCATPGVDYVPASGTLSFAAGDTSKTFFVQTCSDTVYEGDETVNLTLSSPSAPATLGTPNTAVLTIVENDAQTTVKFSAATYTEDESQTAGLGIVRTGDLSGTTTVNFATSNGTGTGGATCTTGVDYVTNSGTVTFNPGDTSKIVSVQLCGDMLNEGDETINLTLSSPSAPATLGTPNTAVLTINNTASQYRNTTNIDVTGIIGAPYPSNIVVAGATGTVGSVKVTLYDINHALSDDLDVLLVGPAGQKFMLMGDAGGANGLTSTATITFDDGAIQVLPDNGVISTGKYEPTTWEPGQTSFPSPAPSGPYAEPGSAVGGTPSLNSAFGGTNPNGTWSLYVRNDVGLLTPVGGNIAGGWGLQILAPTAANVEISGRVTTASGEGIRNATVMLSGGNLTTPVYVQTGTFGAYRFADLAVGQTYVLTVISRRYVFANPTRILNPADNATDEDFVAEPQ